MADGMHWEIRVKAGADKVWDYVSDVAQHGEWGMDDMTIKSVTPGPTKVGSKFEAEGTLLGKRNPSTVTSTDWQPSKMFAFDAEDKSSIMHHTFRFTSEDGGVLIQRDATATKRPLWQTLLLPLFKGTIDKDYNGALAKLKTKLEAGS